MHSPFPLYTTHKRNSARKYRPRGRRVRDGEQAAVVRALTAAKLHLGIPIPPPTLAEAAKMTGSSIGYIQAAITILKAEDANLVTHVTRGSDPLVPAAARVKKRVKVITAIRGASPEDLVAAAKTIGLDAVFDRMLAPAL